MCGFGARHATEVRRHIVQRDLHVLLLAVKALRLVSRRLRLLLHLTVRTDGRVVVAGQTRRVEHGREGSACSLHLLSLVVDDLHVGPRVLHRLRREQTA